LRLISNLLLTPILDHNHGLWFSFLFFTTHLSAPRCAHRPLHADDKAAEEIEIALDLDPLSLHVNSSAAWVHLFLEDYERARQQAHATLDLYPDSLQAYYVLGGAEVALSRFPEAIQAFE